MYQTEQKLEASGSKVKQLQQEVQQASQLREDKRQLEQAAQQAQAQARDYYNQLSALNGQMTEQQAQIQNLQQHLEVKFSR